jgi:uncharacterized membrane protein YhaH (DUF805 family)
MVSLFFGFNGRINRLQYWLGNCGAGLAGFIGYFLVAIIASPQADGPKIDPGQQALTTLALMALVWAVLSWIGLALQVKRFHDRGRSGYFALAPFVPVVVIATSVGGGILADAPGEAVVPGTLIWFLILGCINVWLFIDLGLLGGDREANRFGEPPGPGLSPGRGAGPGAGPSQWRPAAQGSSVAAAEAAMELAIRGQQKAARAPAPVQAQAKVPVLATGAASPSPSFGKRVTR